MPIKPIHVSSKGNNADFKPIEPGVYLARCYQMVDEGTHTDVYPNAKFAAKPARGIRLYWELLQDDDGGEIRMENGKPFTISKQYTMSLDKKANLRKLIDSWRAAPLTEDEAESFEITAVIGKFCMMQISHKPKQDGGVRADVGSIMNTKKKAEGVNEDRSFTVDDPEQDVFATFPDWLQTRINEAEEMKGREMTLVPRESQSSSPEAKHEEPEKSVSEELDDAGF